MRFIDDGKKKYASDYLKNFSLVTYAGAVLGTLAGRDCWFYDGISDFWLIAVGGMLATISAIIGFNLSGRR